MQRDCGPIVYHDLSKVRNQGICPDCGETTIAIARGIEVGNIFQLGDKYTRAMNMQYLASDGEPHFPIMGCYGIGVGRLVASVCEAHHDDNGPIWPLSIAPWQVELCCLRADQPDIKAVGDQLYAELGKAGVEVLYDDRVIRPGVMFSDADLFGIPIRVIISPRNLSQNVIEVRPRNNDWNESVPVNDALSFIINQISGQSSF